MARFNFTIAPAGLPSTFNASESLSPVGTIVNYFWDFGDGITPINTSESTITHSYALPGDYTVTLIVTNSAGTSTTQIFNPASSLEVFDEITSSNANSINITNNGGSSAISVQTITIPSAAPIVLGINPSSGSTCGGTVVTIEGVNFTGATAVFFGSVFATQFTVQSDTTIMATAPAGVPGPVDITVVTPFGTSSVTLVDQFTYLSSNITKISPSSGSICGGTRVAITGTNLSCVTEVLFGSVSAERFTVESDTKIIAISPQGKPGTVDITLITPLSSSVIMPVDQFTYFPPFPPRDLRGRQVKHKFATQTEIMNILTWKAPCSISHECGPVAYRIYRDSGLKELIGEISAHGKHEFVDHNRKNRKKYIYFIVSVDRFGNASSPAKFTIKGEH